MVYDLAVMTSQSQNWPKFRSTHRNSSASNDKNGPSGIVANYHKLPQINSVERTGH